jgi:hypothetical protein
MRDAIAGALLIAAVSTLGDFVWAGLHLRHRVAYGLAHGSRDFSPCSHVAHKSHT